MAGHQVHFEWREHVRSQGVDALDPDVYKVRCECIG